MNTNTKGKFEVFKGQDNQYYFRLKAPNGENIGYSEGYTTKQSANQGIASVRVNSQTTSNFTLWKSQNNNQWYFNLKASNNEIILRSEGYITEQGARNGIAAVQRYAPDAPVDDLTLHQAAY